MMRRLFAVLLCVAACSPAARAPASLSVSGDATVTFLHLNDVYEITPINGGRSGGLARVATLRRQLISSRGLVLTTLAGDFLSPSALGTALVDGQPLAGRQMIATLNAVGVDWATLGNHEFDISEANFRRRLAESRFRYVISNVRDTTGALFPGTVDRAIVEVRASNGRRIKLGMVGTVLPATRASWVRYANQYGAVREAVNAMRDSVDAVVALTHQYYYEDQRLADSVAGIDVILGGHEHEHLLKYGGANRIPIVKADGNARGVQIVTLRFTNGGQRPTVTTEFVAITDAIAEDSATATEVNHWLEKAFLGYETIGLHPREPVTTIPEALDAREATMRVGPTNMTDLLLAAMRRESPQAEIGIFNAGSARIDDVILPGRLTQYDVIRILPYGGPLMEVQMRGDIVERALLAGLQNVGLGGYLHSFGAIVTDGRVLFAGTPIEKTRMYRVVITDYLLTGRERNLAFLALGSEGIANPVRKRDVRMPLIEELKARFGSLTP
jgi:5'-nucleotidase